MPKRTNSLPKYRLHKASGQAIVNLAGRDRYLGRHGSQESREEYDRLTAEWLAAGRPSSPSKRLASEVITVNELIARYYKFARLHYRKNGESTGTAEGYRPALKRLKQTYGSIRVSDFGPKSLKTLQNAMIKDDLSRRYINDNTQRIKRVFEWGVSEEIVPVSVPQGLATVMALAMGRSEARETNPVEPVSDQDVEAVLPSLPPIVADIVRFQRLTGCRPSEACMLRPCDIDRSKDVWIYTPASHKTEHRGKARQIFIGPELQQILKPYPGSANAFPPESLLPRQRRYVCPRFHQ